MNELSYTTFLSLEADLTQQRLERYRWSEDESIVAAMRLYHLNLLLCERLYIPLHMLEIVLRNKIDTVLSHHYGDDWFQNGKVHLNARHQHRIDETVARLNVKRAPYTRDHVIADLTLGIWSSFFNKEYEVLWQTRLHVIGRSEQGHHLTRGYYAKRLDAIRYLRNRVAHHEPILHLNLRLYYDHILEVVHSLSPAAFDWIKAHGTFEPLLEELETVKKKEPL